MAGILPESALSEHEGLPDVPPGGEKRAAYAGACAGATISPRSRWPGLARPGWEGGESARAYAGFLFNAEVKRDQAEARKPLDTTTTGRQYADEAKSFDKDGFFFWSESSESDLSE